MHTLLLSISRITTRVAKCPMSVVGVIGRVHESVLPETQRMIRMTQQLGSDRLFHFATAF